MLNISNSRIFRILAFALVFVLVFSMMGISVFAHDDDDHSSESGESTTTKEKTAFQKWWDAYNQIIGWILSGIVAVALAFVVYLWIPKDDKKAAKNTKKSK